MRNEQMRGLITAIRTLTIFKVPGEHTAGMANSLPYFPLIGGVLGIMTVGVAMLLGRMTAWHTGIGIVCVGFSALVTGGMHLDGLADVFDSLGGRTVERRLEIMKDSSIGSFGAAALLLVLVAKVAAIAQIAGQGRLIWLIVPFVVSRLVQVQLIVSLPYARAEGGLGKGFVEGAKVYHFVLAFIIAFLLCLTWGGLGGMVLVCGVFLLCHALAFWMRRMFGGVTGDLIGMGSELAETGVLMFMAF